MPRFVPRCDRLSSKRVLWGIVDVEIVDSLGSFNQHLSCAVAQELVKNDPPVVRRILVLLILFNFRGVNERETADLLLSALILFAIMTFLTPHSCLMSLY